MGFHPNSGESVSFGGVRSPGSAGISPNTVEKLNESSFREGAARREIRKSEKKGIRAFFRKLFRKK